VIAPVNKISILKPDDWHLHLRDGKILKGVLRHTADVFCRAIIMPNLDPPITTINQAKDYKQRISQSIPKGASFTPLMTAYLTDDISSKVLERGFREGIFYGSKLYPVNVTTNSSYGVTDLRKIDNIFETMERIGMPLLIHGEVNDLDVDVFDREAVFIDRHLDPLLQRFPSLKVVLEHITTIDAIDFVENSKYDIAATITPHHLHINRNAMFLGGFRSDFYCLPTAKREIHRIALRQAATSGKSCFFLGTDSAPHTRKFKESSCGCAGIFNAPFALESYLKVFEEEKKLEKFEAFASINGAKFYGLPLNQERITLIKKDISVPQLIDVGLVGDSNDFVKPFHSGETLSWSILRAEK
tara:strand:- start:74 stop:1144 length:1071 start_codon:yes stop_codon:yes gene_type:complete